MRVLLGWTLGIDITHLFFVLLSQKKNYDISLSLPIFTSFLSFSLSLSSLVVEIYSYLFSSWASLTCVHFSMSWCLFLFFIHTSSSFFQHDFFSSLTFDFPFKNHNLIFINCPHPFLFVCYLLCVPHRFVGCVFFFFSWEGYCRMVLQT